MLKKSLLCLAVVSSCALIHLTASAIKPASNSTATSGTKATSSDADAYISDLYSALDFGKGQKLNAEVFEKAMKGYLNLQVAGRLNEDKQILSVADFTKSSTENRLWVIDIKAKKVIYNTYVAHGQGSGMDMATTFSNQDGTHASSLGFYVTDDTYVGQHGNSLRLRGQDKGFNDAAYDRGIVVHAADYVSKSNIAGQGRLGRSWGCPAVAPELAQPIINTIKGGTCLFIYYPQPTYLKTAYWMNKKVSVPGANVVENTRLALTSKGDTATANRL